MENVYKKRVNRRGLTGFVKRVISVLLCTALILCMPDGFPGGPLDAVSENRVAKASVDLWTNHAASSFGDQLEGAGESEDNPILISTAEQLAYLSKQTKEDNNFGKGKYFKLAGNINLSGHEWTPIGTFSSYNGPGFQGMFDGDGYSIFGMTITQDNASGAGHVGLFSKVTSGAVKNVKVAGYIRIDDPSVAIFAGGIVAWAYGTSVTDCSFSGEIFVTNTNRDTFAGGIVGHSEDNDDISTRLERCCNHGTISLGVSPDNNVGYAGGIAARLDSPSVKNCYNDGAITVTDANVAKIGGIASHVSTGRVFENCFNTGVLTSSGSRNENVGHISNDYPQNDILTNCFYREGTQITRESIRSDGTRLSAEDFSDLTRFTGFDPAIWAIDSTEGRPVLRSELGNTVSLTAGANMSLAPGTGAEIQTVGANQAISDVIYTANDGCEFPETYSVNSLNGISVTRLDSDRIKVSGTPTALLTEIVLSGAVRNAAEQQTPTDRVLPYIPPYEPEPEPEVVPEETIEPEQELAPEEKPEPEENPESDPAPEENPESDPAPETKPLVIKPRLKASSKNGKALLTWKEVEGATKYRIYQKVGKKFKKLRTVKKLGATIGKGYITEEKNGKKVTKIGKLVPSKTYTFAIRAFVGGKWTEITKSSWKKVQIKN